MSPVGRVLLVHLQVTFVIVCQLIVVITGQTNPGDKAALTTFLNTLQSHGDLPVSTSDDYCSSAYEGYIDCRNGLITQIKLTDFAYGGTLTSSLGQLSNLLILRLQNSSLVGEIPSELGDCIQLEEIQLSGNPGLGAFPAGFFTKLTQLKTLNVGGQLNGSTFAGDTFPPELENAAGMEVLNVGQSNLRGPIPDTVGKLTKLQYVTLSYNNFNSFPEIFTVPLRSLLSLRVNNNLMLTGPIPQGIGTMLPGITELWLHVCNFTGTLPESISATDTLQSLKLNDNYYLTGIVPPLPAGVQVDLHSTLFIGPRPSLLADASPDLVRGTNFCSTSGPCDAVTTALIQLLKSFNYPLALIKSGSPPWTGSFSCASPWQYLTCDGDGPTSQLQRLGLSSMKLQGSISPYLANLTTLTFIDLSGNSLSGGIPDLNRLQSLKRLYLQQNNLTGAVPEGLTTIPTLTQVDVSSNRITSVPNFPPTVTVIKLPNPIGDAPAPSPRPGPTAAPTASPPSATPSVTPTTPTTPTSPGASPSAPPGTTLNNGSTTPPSGATAPSSSNQNSSGNGTGNKSNKILPLIGGVIGGVVLLLIIGAGLCCFFVVGGRKKQTSQVQSPGVYESFQGDEVESLKSEGSRASKKSYNSTKHTTHSVLTVGSAGGMHQRGPSDVGSILSEAADRNPLFLPSGPNLSFPLELIQEATNNFASTNILGKGGFGTVYRGQFADGSMIAVKRMEVMGLTARGQAEFDAEIMVLTRVRHRHLVALLGYCVSGSERLLIYEYLSQGPLSRHIFDHRKYNLTPLNWKTRVSIALDIARGMEYLHGLAQSSFIHRDLKPSNVLIDNEFRAKVADFGLVKLAPSGFSVETRLAGTFGYLAPEYAATGRVTTKSDVYSYGVMLMELITGRKALDEHQSEADMHLVTWFAPMIRDRTKLRNVVDPTLQMDDSESWNALCKVADLSAQCTSRDPHQRPQMDNCVGMLMPLVQVWQPDRVLDDDTEGIDPAIQASALRPWDRDGWDATDTFEPTNAFPAGPILSPGDRDHSTSLMAEVGSTHDSIPSNHRFLQVSPLHNQPPGFGP